jgi:hypothetical protein
MKVVMDLFKFEELSEVSKRRVNQEYGRDVVNSYNWESFIEPFRKASERLGVETLLFDVDRVKGGIIIFGVINRAGAVATTLSEHGDPTIQGRMVFIQEEPGEMGLFMGYECDNHEGITQGIMSSLQSLANTVSASWTKQAEWVLSEKGLTEFFADLEARFLEDGTWIKADSTTFQLLN